MPGPYDSRGEKVNEVNTYDVFGSHTPFICCARHLYLTKIAWKHPKTIPKSDIDTRRRDWLYVDTKFLVFVRNNSCSLRYHAKRLSA